MIDSRVVIVIPGFNVAHVLKKTISELSPQVYDEIILVDDGSVDATAEVGRQLGLTVIRHDKNKGYGAAQKTGFKAALKRGASVIVVLHGDNQYDPSFVASFIQKLLDQGYDLVTGTRMILGDALSHGMPVWKYYPNRFYTWMQNCVLHTHLSDYHNGFRAYTARFLSQVPLDLLSDEFDFDTDIIIQGVIRNMKIAEVPHPTRYLKENSKMSSLMGIRYGLRILRILLLYSLHKAGIYRQKVFII